MRKHIDKRIVVLMLLLVLVMQPWPGGSGWPFGGVVVARESKPAHPCRAVKMWKYLMVQNAFVFGFTPFTPVAIAFGVGALAAEAYDAIYC